MVKTQTNPIQRLTRRRKIVSKKREGMSKVDIGVELAVSGTTIDRDMKAIENNPELYGITERAEGEILRGFTAKLKKFDIALETILNSADDPNTKIRAITEQRKTLTEYRTMLENTGTIKTIKQGMNINVNQSCDKCTILDKLIENKLICSESCSKRKWQESAIDVDFTEIEDES